MSVLGEIASRYSEAILVRFASHRTDEEFMSEQEMSPGQVDEMKEFLNSRGMSDSLEKLVGAPFEPKRRLFKSGYPESRFSDGSFPVGYFSLEPETAEAEARHWFRKNFAGKPSGDRIAWYSRFTCDFRGDTKDLRPMQTRWPDLTHENDYTFCIRLGAEAVRENLDGLLTPSVRKPGGTNVPVFARRALSNPREHSLVEIHCDLSRDTTEH